MQKLMMNFHINKNFLKEGHKNWRFDPPILVKTVNFQILGGRAMEV